MPIVSANSGSVPQPPGVPQIVPGVPKQITSSNVPQFPSIPSVHVQQHNGPQILTGGPSLPQIVSVNAGMPQVPIITTVPQIVSGNNSVPQLVTGVPQLLPRPGIQQLVPVSGVPQIVSGQGGAPRPVIPIQPGPNQVITPGQLVTRPQVSGPPQPGVPPLTEQQKRIVAEFKTKIARLPPQEQVAYIAQNRMNLIKQLNFQPNQLKILQNNQQPQQQLPLGHPSIRQPTPSLPQHHMRPTLATNVTNLDTTRATVPTIDKSKKIAWFETQLRNDQKEATQPNYKTPFRSREDTCKRLLRYHVYNEETMDQQDLIRADLEFEKKAETLLERYQVNLSKYHLLLLDESTRLCSSACEAMLGRMWVAEEKSALAREKEEYRSRCNR